MIPCFKSSYSLTKSILTLDIPKDPDPDLPDSIFSLAQEGNLNKVVIIDDTISSFLPAVLNGQKLGLIVVFGLRMSFVTNSTDKSDESFFTSHKNVIFPKNKSGYHRLIKLSTIANCDNFYKEPRLSYNDLHNLWDGNDLALAIPFYDSFLHKNTLTHSLCLPDYRDIKPTVFIESNELPFDHYIENAANNFAKSNNLAKEKVKTIYYRYRKDFEAYLTLKCLNRKQFGSGRTLNSPDFEHMSSREFSWESYLEKTKINS